MLTSRGWRAGSLPTAPFTGPLLNTAAEWVTGIPGHLACRQGGRATRELGLGRSLRVVCVDS